MPRRGRLIRFPTRRAQDRRSGGGEEPPPEELKERVEALEHRWRRVWNDPIRLLRRIRQLLDDYEDDDVLWILLAIAVPEILRVGGGQ